MTQPPGRHRTRAGARWLAPAVALLAAAAAADPPDVPPANDPASSTRPAASPATVPASVDELAAPLPTTPGDHKLRFRTHVDGKPIDMVYLLHLPSGYDTATAGPAPLLVFLHGSGEAGTDLAGIYTHGPMSLLKRDGGNADFAATCPFVILSPQCPPRGQRWEDAAMTRAVDVLVDSVVRRGRVDPDRVYLTGLSMGGQGTWCVAELDPGRFAAIAPMNGLGWHPDAAAVALRDVPVWSSVGLNDEAKFVDAAHAMDAALAGAPAARRFSYLIGNGHDAFWPTYQDPDFYEWLLAHRRGHPGPAVTRAAPTTPGRHFCAVQTKVADQPYQLDYVLTLPPGYAAGHRYPTVLFLREADTVGPDLDDVCGHGPDLALARDPTLAAACPMVVVSPHWPAKCDWQTPGMTPALLGLLDHLRSAGVGIDPDRVSVTGVNAGANGAWKLVAEAPDRFSAALPVETNVPPPVADDQMATVAHVVPGRAYVTAADTATAGRLAHAAAGSSHDWATVALPAAAGPLTALPPYADPAVLGWLTAQRRPAEAASAAAK